MAAHLPVFFKRYVELTSDICNPTDLHVEANMYVQKGVVGWGWGWAVPLCMLSQNSEETSPSPRTFSNSPRVLPSLQSGIDLVPDLFNTDFDGSSISNLICCTSCFPALSPVT